MQHRLPLEAATVQVSDPVFSAAGQPVATWPSAAQLFPRSVSLQHLSPAVQTLPAGAAPAQDSGGASTQGRAAAVLGTTNGRQSNMEKASTDKAAAQPVCDTNKPTQTLVLLFTLQAITDIKF